MVYRDGLMPIIGRSLGPRSGRIGPLLLLLILVGSCRRPGGAESEIEQTYRSACGRCHGADGKGGFAPEGQNPPRNFCDAAFQRDRSDEQLGAARGACPRSAICSPIASSADSCRRSDASDPQKKLASAVPVTIAAPPAQVERRVRKK